MLTALLCAGGSGDTCYLALSTPHIATDVQAQEGPLFVEPNTNNFAKVCLLISLFTMTLNTQNMVFQSFSAQTDNSIPFYVLLITSPKHFNLKIHHWWNLYYMIMLGQDLLTKACSSFVSQYALQCSIVILWFPMTPLRRVMLPVRWVEFPNGPSVRIKGDGFYIWSFDHDSHSCPVLHSQVLYSFQLFKK